MLQGNFLSFVRISSLPFHSTLVNALPPFQLGTTRLGSSRLSSSFEPIISRHDLKQKQTIWSDLRKVEDFVDLVDALIERFAEGDLRFFCFGFLLLSTCDQIGSLLKESLDF
ncbi:hypothetical protein CKAN_01499700 [Cinnamomum micranthum f. kanehirae]|uniref:Uncharacterized protein n=1 Tax=Cinnamomum micranthum f. kanehirae TaxID=337451 RepID=A0A3S3QJL1_9MAGN|nr:hypothetical protein CKAN_01499700 [Cinnamomum micranthum f. kanehirae]